MKQASRALVAATMVVAVCAAPAAAHDETASPPRINRADLQERLDDIVDAGAVGALVEVRDERGSWRTTSGAAALDRRRPVPAQGRFRAGSITKTFVATVVLQLVDQGRLSLDDSVDKWLPGTVPDGDHITVRHLLNHTSGLYDFKDTLPMPPSQAFFDNRWRTWTADEMVRQAVANPPTFEPPGRAFDYSNTNYTLLGQIIEAVTGQPYDEVIEHRIIHRLGLRHTSLPGSSPQIRGPHPHGYVPLEMTAEPPLLDYTEMNPSVFGASGELISTTRDLNRFFAALLDGRLLPARLLDAMQTPGIADGRYGLGLAWLDTSCGIRLYGNDGDALTYQSWSYATEYGRQVTLALTPNFRADLDTAVEDFLDAAFCG